MAGEHPIATVNAGLRFLLEAAALVILGYWGYTAGEGVTRFVLGLGIPLAVAAVWALVGAPAAPYRLGQPWRIGLEVLFLGGAAAGLVALELPATAIGFGVVAAINTVLLYLLGGD